MTLKKLIPLLLSFVLLTSCTARGEEQKDNPLSSITPEAPSTSSPLLKDENEDPPFIAAEPRHRVLVSYGEDKKDYLAQGSDTLLLTYRCRTPHVELPGQEMQAQEINMSLASLAESFRQGKDEESGLEHMLSSVATIYALEPDPSMFIPHAYERDCSTVRGDSKVISFLFSDYVNSGGAHGGTCWSGVNFNPATGKPLSLTDLSDDIDALRTLRLTEILAQCNGMKDMLFEGYANAVPELFADGLWYMNDSGLVFIANEYHLAPYAAGPICFTIRYKALKGVMLEQFFLPQRDSVQGGIEVLPFGDANVPASEPLLSVKVNEQGEHVVLHSFNSVYNVRLFTVTYEETTGQFYGQSELAYLSLMQDGEYFDLYSYFPDVIPNLRLSWRLPDGSTQRYLLSQSGMDGSIFLSEESTLPRIFPGELSGDSVYWDLDGDGEQDSLYLRKDQEWSIFVAPDKSIATAFTGDLPRIFVTDVDEDNCCELILESNNTLRCWRYDGNLHPVDIILKGKGVTTLNATIIDADTEGLHLSCNIPLFSTVLPAHALLRDGPNRTLALAYGTSWEFFTDKSLALPKELTAVRQDGATTTLPPGAVIYPTTMDDSFLSYTTSDGGSGKIALSQLE